MARSSQTLPFISVGKTDGGESASLFVQSNGALAFCTGMAPPAHTDVWPLGVKLQTYLALISLFEYGQRYAILATTLALPREGPVDVALEKQGHTVSVTFTFGVHRLCLSITELVTGLNTLCETAKQATAA